VASTLRLVDVTGAADGLGGALAAAARERA